MRLDCDLHHSECQHRVGDLLEARDVRARDVVARDAELLGMPLAGFRDDVPVMLEEEARTLPPGDPLLER